MSAGLGQGLAAKSASTVWLLDDDLSVLKATDKKSDNYRLLDDYGVWFMNNR